MYLWEVRLNRGHFMPCSTLTELKVVAASASDAINTCEKYIRKKYRTQKCEFLRIERVAEVEAVYGR